MKKNFIIIILVSLGVTLFSQTYTATLSLDSINVKGYNPGDEIIVPVKIKNKSGGMLLGFQFYIGFDHNVLQWKGSMENPVTGIVNFNEKMPYNPNDWTFNDNGNQLVVLWNDPKLVGIPIGDNDIHIISIIFTYKGGIERGGCSELVWGQSVEIENGRIKRGKTEMYSEKTDYYKLTLNNSCIYKEN